MLEVILEYIKLKHNIRKSKFQGYGGYVLKKIYPRNQEKLKKEGYTVIKPGGIDSSYHIRW